MDDTHETIADIAAEKRRIAKEVRDYASNGDYWDKKRANETAEDLEEEADLLEAALKRERGDAAKLREALDESMRIAADLGGCRLNDYWKLNEIVRVCEAALSAPPRNCDVYDSYGDAIRAFEDDENAEGYEDMAEWLFAPAAEKEGGGK